MSIHAMCLVKDEADIIDQCLTEALEWAGHIYVFDNGSTDETWDQVQKLATVHRQIVPFKQEDAPFTDGLRSQIFNTYRGMSEPGDWWCRLDADEFYIDSPRSFLAAVPDQYRTVWTAAVDFYFTDADAREWEKCPESYGDDVSIEQKCRYYLSHWSEMRFFRYHPGITWARGSGHPDSLEAAAAHPKRIRQANYAYRSPEQIEKRLRARLGAVQRGEFAHEALANWGDVIGSIRDDPSSRLANPSHHNATFSWRDRVVDASKLDYDDHDGVYVINEHLMPRLPVGPPTGFGRLRHQAGRVKRRMSRG